MTFSFERGLVWEKITTPLPVCFNSLRENPGNITSLFQFFSSAISLAEFKHGLPGLFYDEFSCIWFSNCQFTKTSHPLLLVSLIYFLVKVNCSYTINNTLFYANGKHHICCFLWPIGVCHEMVISCEFICTLVGRCWPSRHSIFKPHTCVWRSCSSNCWQFEW